MKFNNQIDSLYVLKLLLEFIPHQITCLKIFKISNRDATRIELGCLRTLVKIAHTMIDNVVAEKIKSEYFTLQSKFKFDNGIMGFPEDTYNDFMQTVDHVNKEIADAPLKRKQRVNLNSSNFKKIEKFIEQEQEVMFNDRLIKSLFNPGLKDIDLNSKEVKEFAVKILKEIYSSSLKKDKGRECIEICEKGGSKYCIELNKDRAKKDMIKIRKGILKAVYSKQYKAGAEISFRKVAASIDGIPYASDEAALKGFKWKNFYNVCSSLNEKIYKETGRNLKLLECTRKFVKRNF